MAMQETRNNHTTNTHVSEQKPSCEDERKNTSYPFLSIITPKRYQIPFGRERASQSKRSRSEALTSKNSPGHGSGFPDLLYLKPPRAQGFEERCERREKCISFTNLLGNRAVKEARSMVPQAQDIGNSRSLGVVCCHASSACSGEELVMHVYIDLDAAFLFSPLCPSSLSMAVVPKSMRVSWMGCNDEMEHTNSRRKEWLFA